MLVFVIACVGAFAAALVGASITLYFERALYKADAWSEGYWQGVADTYTAIDVNEPGYGPNRVNPYRDWRTGAPLTAKEMWGQWRGYRQTRRGRRAMRRMERRPMTRSIWPTQTKKPSERPVPHAPKPNEESP